MNQKPRYWIKDLKWIEKNIGETLEDIKTIFEDLAFFILIEIRIISEIRIIRSGTMSSQNSSTR